MSNAWSARSILKVPSVSGVVSDLPVSNEATISRAGSLNGVIKLKYSGVTQVGTITPKLQTAVGNDWVDVKSGTAITADGIQYIKWNIEVAADQPLLPLLNKLRIVLTTTNAGDIISFNDIELLQGL